MDEQHSATSQHKSGDGLRMILWSVLVLGATGNVVASAVTASIAVNAAFGAVTVVAIAGLVADWKKARA